MAHRRPDTGADAARPDFLDDPPSIDDATPTFTEVSVVVGDGEDYPDDAPTITVADLAELGIDPDDLAEPETRPRQRVREVQIPPTPPARPATPVHREPPRMKREEPRRGPSVAMVVAAALPVVIALGGAAFMLWGA